MKRLGRYTLLFERRPAILGHAAVLSLRSEPEDLTTASGTPVTHVAVSTAMLRSKEGIYLAL